MNTISRTLLQIAAVASLSTGFGLAQSPNDLKAFIPFDFTIGNRTLPSGDYTISSVDVGSSVMLIRDESHRVQTLVMSNTGDKPAEPNYSRLAFRVHGGKHYLASTWNASTGTGREFGKTPAEREAELAAGPTTHVVLIASK